MRRRPWKPWPFPVLLGGMVVFGAVAAAFGLGIAGVAVLGAIATAMALGRP